MKILVLKGKDRHTIRLLGGLRACNVDFQIIEVNNPLNIKERYDIAMIDPSIDKDFFVYADRYMFFDTEDGPSDGIIGPAYYVWKDKVCAWAKYNYLDDDRKDGIKNIAIPIDHFLNLRKYSEINLEPFSFKHALPFISCSPTFLGSYNVTPNVMNSETREGIDCLSKFDDGKYMYNQRYDWILSLRENNIPYVGGIVFGQNSNLSVEWQSKYFGQVEKLGVPPINHNLMMNMLQQYRVGLCPTGHERISFRMFDIMAAGSILIFTENSKKLKTLIMPKEYITIIDGQDLGYNLLKLQPQYKEIWKACQENRKVFQTLNSSKLLTLFLKQVE